MRAARKLDMTPDAIRRKNFIPPKAMPYTTATGKVYDSGEFAAHHEARDGTQPTGRTFPSAPRLAKKAGLRARHRAWPAMSRFAAPWARRPPPSRLEPDGDFTMLIGSQSSGQGHQTAYAQLVADQFGIRWNASTSFRAIRTMIATGRGTGGSSLDPRPAACQRRTRHARARQQSEGDRRRGAGNHRRPTCEIADGVGAHRWHRSRRSSLSICAKRARRRSSEDDRERKPFSRA